MSTKQLPRKPHLDVLKKQARYLLKAHQSGEMDACARIKVSIPRQADAVVAEIVDATFTLRDAQLVVAREYGFASWPRLSETVSSMTRSDELQSGNLIAQYRIVRELGKSGMGEVYLAEDTTLKRQVARRLQVSGSTVYRLVKRGALSCRNIGRSKRFTPIDVERYLMHVQSGVGA